VTAPYLVACLVTLRAEFNELAPDRDKGSDGWIGDTAHRAENSDHNPDSRGRVLAVDIDSTGPWPVSFSTMVESVRGDYRLEYIIWNRRIASRDRGWTWRKYTGTTDPHTSHAHFSARHDHTGNTSTASWHLEDIPMALTKQDKDWIAAQIANALNVQKVPVSTEQWQADTAIGYSARKAFELQRDMPTAEEIADAVVAKLNPAGS
jgi:hypothetical protein